MSRIYTPTHIPASSGPRLQTGDILLIGGRTCRIKALLPTSKAVACEICRFSARDFTINNEYALAHRCRAPRLPQTVALHACLRRSESPSATLLRAAAAEGHLDAVDRSTQSALMLAAQRGLDAAVRDLLLHGVKVDFPDADGETALLKAARAGHVSCVALLLGADAALDVPSGGGYTPLMAASGAGQHACVTLLLRRGASVEPCEHSTSGAPHPSHPLTRARPRLGSCARTHASASFCRRPSLRLLQNGATLWASRARRVTWRWHSCSPALAPYRGTAAG